MIQQPIDSPPASPPLSEQGASPAAVDGSDPQTGGPAEGVAEGSADGPAVVGAEPDQSPLEALVSGNGNTVLGGMLLAAGVTMLVIVSLNMARKARRRSKVHAQDTPAERIETIRETASREGAHELYAVRSAETARRYAALVDNKAARLEQLIAEADDLLARLEAVASHESSELRTAGDPDEADRPAGVASSEDERAVPRTTGPSASGLPSGRGPAPSIAPEPDPLKARVFDLADEGVEPVEIARRIGTHTGKVELILALRKATRAS
ncbi:MAG: hypothetical protein AAF108_08075 [Planctomycetota bacterium]